MHYFRSNPESLEISHLSSHHIDRVKFIFRLRCAAYHNNFQVFNFWNFINLWFSSDLFFYDYVGSDRIYSLSGSKNMRKKSNKICFPQFFISRANPINNIFRMIKFDADGLSPIWWKKYTKKLGNSKNKSLDDLYFTLPLFYFPSLQNVILLMNNLPCFS